MNHHWSDCLCPATSDQTRVGKVRTWLHVETEFREERGNPELLLLFILSPAQRKERFLYKPIRAQTHLTSHVILHNHSLLSNNSDSDYCVTRPLFSIQSNTVFLLLNVCFEWHSGSSQFRVIGSLTSWWVKRGDFAMLSENCFVCLSGPITWVWGRDYLPDWLMSGAGICTTVHTSSHMFFFSNAFIFFFLSTLRFVISCFVALTKHVTFIKLNYNTRNSKLYFA